MINSLESYNTIFVKNNNTSEQYQRRIRMGGKLDEQFNSIDQTS